MDIEVPLRDLGEVDAAALRSEVLAASEAEWQSNRHRQSAYEVHYNTQSLVMLFVDTDHWPRARVTRESAWSRLADAAMPLMDDILARHYPTGGLVIRALAARLAPGAVIKPHSDAHASFHAGHRIHVPITTNDRVRFTLQGCPYQLASGRAYEINNQLHHSVMNKGREPRIHFIFDYVPPSQLSHLQIEAAA